METNTDKIYYITIIPQSQYTAKYLLNDSTEFHSKTLEELLTFILSLLPKKVFYLIVEELLYSFIPFFIDIQNKEIVELESDLTANLEEYREMVKNPNIKLLTNNRKKKKTLLNTFKQVSNKNIPFPLDFITKN